MHIRYPWAVQENLARERADNAGYYNKSRVKRVCISQRERLFKSTYCWGLENTMSWSSVSDSSESEGTEYTTGLVIWTGNLSSVYQSQ